ncbi:putative metalloprotease [Kribbella aluminosa]|uniref:Metalloprotease n=1 Tax=Kribbella aluminosa TaxID=416017 RepID=A0ABS4UT82_9ACTN|nr:neutral zinc metallopeptidase [Kribbella aluminosa]MBP2354847.1 putative metalloprotease [Kribbella aluminosa]
MSNQGPYGPPPGQYPPPQQYVGPQQHAGPPQQYAGPPQYPGGPQYGPPPGPPNWGPPQGRGFGFSPPPPKKKSKAVFVVVPLVVLFGAVGLFLVSAILKHNGHDTYTQPQPTATEYPTEPATTSAPATTRPTQPARTTTTTEPSTTRTTPTGPSDLDLVARNKIYRSGVMSTVNCRESGARPSSAANARKYYTNLISCLVRAWPKQVRLAGGRFVPPNLVAFSGSATSPCGGSAPSSFYCSSNRTIYMDAGSDIKYYQQYSNNSYAMAWVRAEMTDTVAHEFGHHVQNMVGILQADSNLRYEYSGDKSLEMSRRLEIQATCFGNVFMGSNRSSYRISGAFKSQLDYLHSHQGDEYGTQRDHGSRAIIPRWADAGFSTRSPRGCNTFTASPTYVR